MKTNDTLSGKHSRSRFSFILIFFVFLAALSIFLLGQSTSAAALAMESTSQAIHITPTATATPETPAISSDPFTPDNTVAPELDRQPPLYEVPLALNLHDHFFFIRPVAINTNNLPLENYRYGYIFPNEEAVHTGIDISSPLDTPVLAAGSGKVVFTGYGLLYGAGNVEDPYGIVVIIRHDFMYQDYTVYTVYCHLGYTTVDKGDQVKTGDQIGVIGMTGKTSGPHVHFEIRLSNKEGDIVQNPELWIAPTYGDGVLAGRITSIYGALLPAQSITLTSKETGRVWIIFTYAKKIRWYDAYFRENLAVGDFPAGEYKISTEYKGKTYKSEITISPGTVNYIRFHGEDGFSQQFPDSPDPSEFLD